MLRRLLRLSARLAVIVALVLAASLAADVVALAQVATQNTVQTTGPVTSETTISVGTLAGQALNWIMVVFAPIIGTVIVWVLVRVLQKLGIDATDALRARLQEFVVNGLNTGAKKLERSIEGKGKVEIKNAIAAETVRYVQEHGAETLKALGVDPNSNAAVDAIKARIETAIADPMTPTPAVLDPASPAPPKQGV